MVAWLLIHSPVVGPAIWLPTAAQLRQRAQEVTIPDLTPAVSAAGDHVSRMADLVVAAARLSSGYDAFADQAEQAGWPVHRLEDHHLAILTSPVEIADTLQDSLTPR